MKIEYFPITEFFIFPSIKGITKSFIEKHKGGIPVYGGKMYGEPIGYVQDNLLNVKYFENCLAWNREGSVGYVFFHTNKFTTNDHHRPLVLKESYQNIIDLEYARIVLQNQLLSMGFKWSITASKEIVSSLQIPMPINNGEIDLTEQTKFVNKYNKYQTFQTSLRECKNKLIDSDIAINNNHKTVQVPISDNKVFFLKIGDRILKKDISNDGIPIYSANVFKPFGYKRNVKYNKFSKRILIWGIDGIFDWNILPENYKFIPTDHCGVLEILNENILPEYIYYYLKSTKERYGFDRVFRASLENMKENVVVEIPVDKKGDYDLAAQQQIANQYIKIEKIKIAILDQLEKIENVNIIS